MSANVEPSASQVTLHQIRAAIARLVQSDLPPAVAAELRQIASGVEHLELEMAAAEELGRQNLLDAEQTRARFTSNLMHELRLPMTSIKGYTDLLRQGVAGPLNQRQLTFLEIIGKNTDRMADLATAVSDIARIDSGRMKIDARVIDVEDPINNTIQALQPALNEKKQKLIKESQQGALYVLVDPGRLEQVAHHVLRNAIMYTPNEGMITITITAEVNRIRIEIHDTGIGILPAEQEYLFTPFFRSENPIVRDQPGWGLGLYLSSRLLALMNGELGVWSNLGEGSRFWFTVPTTQG